MASVPNTNVSLRGIARAVRDGDYNSSVNWANVSLHDIETNADGNFPIDTTQGPDGLNPNSMGEFRGYTPYSTFYGSIITSYNSRCGQNTTYKTSTQYWADSVDGSGWPTVGSTVYVDAVGTPLLMSTGGQVVVTMKEGGASFSTQANGVVALWNSAC